MVNFIQSTDMQSEIPGSAGQQSVVQGPDYAGAAASLTQNAMQSLDSYSKIYSKDKAQSLVEDELENIDKARAEAEMMSSANGETEVPESVRMSQDEWTTFSTAVQNGEMDPDRARLIAGSRLRSRIAQEPMFSRQLRQAASGVLGFNIESIGAQQYFSSFKKAEPTEQQKLWQEAQTEAQVLGIPAEKVYRQMFEVKAAERNKILTKQRQEEGTITASEAFTEFNKENSAAMFPTFMGAIKAAVNEHGSLKEEQWEATISELEQAELNELTTEVWGDAPQNTLEFERAQGQIADRYDGLRTLVESVGYDKLLQTALDRKTNERKLIEEEEYRDVKIMNSVGGQAAVQAWFDIQSRAKNPTQLRQMMEQFPIFERIARTNGMGDDEVAKMLPRLTRKLVAGEDLDNNEDQAAGAAAAIVHDNTEDEDTKTNIIKRLEELGKKTAAMSIVAKASPDVTSIENVKGAVAKYKTELPRLMTDLSNKIAAHQNQKNILGQERPAIDYSIDDKGDVVVSTMRPLSLPQGVMDDLKSTAAAINQYNKAHRNGWSREFGEEHDQYVAKLDKNLKRVTSVEFTNTQSDFKSSVLSGNRKSAREKYERLRELNPEAFANDFEHVYSAIRRARIEAESGGE